MKKLAKSFSTEHLRRDLMAGLVVYFVALPLCLGIASASTGRSDLLLSGIVAGIIGGIITGFLSNSQVGVSGPAAGLVTLVVMGITQAGSYQAFMVAVIIAGIFQIIAGFLKLGSIAYYIPSSVIKGMLAAIGIILILKQIPHALGYDVDLMSDENFVAVNSDNPFSNIVLALSYNQKLAWLISLVSFLILFLFEMSWIKKNKILSFIPGSLIVVIAGLLINELFRSQGSSWTLNDEHLVKLPVVSFTDGSWRQLIISPDFSRFSLKIVEIGFIIAFVASIETLLCVEATDKLDPERRTTPTNRELVAQGVGNIFSGFFGGLPITQVIVRSSANINSGGKTKFSTIFHGFLLLSTVLLIPTLLNKIPMAALAMILIFVGYKLAKLSLFKSMYLLGWEQFLPFIVTVIGVVTTDLLKGVFMGLVVALFFILRRNFKNAYTLETSEENGKKFYHIKLSEEVTYLNKGIIMNLLSDIEENSKVIIDGSKSISIDYDVLEVIMEFDKIGASFKNIDVSLVKIPQIQK
ncbi:MAG: SulP family inorganic anion transporter [Chitinophagales bacterium]|nr:SulP family inorganic anion transporter [Chitinophagales bacterium]